MSDVTRILDAVRQGDAQAAEELLPLVYDELRRLATSKMANEPPGQTLQATALVHEAWLKLVGRENPEWNDRTHFFNAAAEAMRRILVDNARRKRSARHGGGLARADLAEVELPLPMRDDELLALDEALERLHAFDARAADLTKLCFFVGLTQEQAAQELGISLRSAERLWAFARAFLAREIEASNRPP
ncbi:MAG: sigma-70 family RNA polymerase sigma factor [Verrucomicrobiae bacterium]|nr:sigma-70 family RNA polymerase sigma factor [Verrucomicrobiae bacterium]